VWPWTIFPIIAEGAKQSKLILLEKPCAFALKEFIFVPIAHFHFKQGYGADFAWACMCVCVYVYQIFHTNIPH